jgi:hypothetical protein
MLTILLIIFDCVLLFALVFAFSITLSTSKKLKDYKESHASLKELADNFEVLIEKCDLQGAKYLEIIEKSKDEIENIIEEIENKKIEILDINKKFKTQVVEHPQIELHDHPDNSYTLKDHLNQKYKEIYKLADSGRTSKEIERLIDLPQGEIDLILGLRE